YRERLRAARRLIMSNETHQLLEQNTRSRSRGFLRRRVRSSPRLELLEERALLSTFRVNTTLDTVAVDLRTGKDASGHISLRSAIMAADAKGGSNTISL